MQFVYSPGLKALVSATAYDPKGKDKRAIREEDPVIYPEHKHLRRLLALREVSPEPVLRVTAPDAPVPRSAPPEEPFLPNATRVPEAGRRLAARRGPTPALEDRR